MDKREPAAVAALLLPALLTGCGSDDGGRTKDLAGAPAPLGLPQSDSPVELDPAELGPDVTNALEPAALEHKFYARGVGPVVTLDVANGGREVLLAVTMVSDAEALAAATAPLGSAY